MTHGTAWDYIGGEAVRRAVTLCVFGLSLGLLLSMGVVWL